MTPAVTIAHACTGPRDHSEVADVPSARRAAMAFGPSGCLRCWCNGRHLPGPGPLSLHPVCAMQDRKQGAGALTAGSGERQDEQMEPAVGTSVHSGSVRKSSLTWRLSIRRRSRSPSFLLWRTTVPVGASSTRRVRCGLSHSVAEMRHRPRDRSEVATRRALQRGPRRVSMPMQRVLPALLCEVVHTGLATVRS